MKNLVSQNEEVKATEGIEVRQKEVEAMETEKEAYQKS